MRLKPDFADAHSALGVVRVAQGQIDAGIAHYGEAIRLSPDDTRTHFDLGIVLAMQGKTEAAIAQYAETVRLETQLLRMPTSIWGLVSHRSAK